MALIVIDIAIEIATDNETRKLHPRPMDAW